MKEGVVIEGRSADKEEGGNVDRQKADVHTLSFSWRVFFPGPVVDYRIAGNFRGRKLSRIDEV